MAKKEKKSEERKIRKTNGTFEIVGKLRLNEKSFSGDTSASGYEWERFNGIIDTGKGNSVFVQGMGGYNPDSPMPFRIYQGKDMFEVSWEDRGNEKILESIKYNKITLALTKGEDGKLVYKDYLSWYDAIDELKEKDEENYVLNGAIVKIKGNINWNEYKENTNPQYEVTKIYLSEANEEDFHATFKQVVLFNSDGMEKSVLKLLKEGKYDDLPDTVEINSYLMDYDSTNKVTRPYQFKYVVKKDDYHSVEQFAKILLKLYVGKNKVLEFELLGDIVNRQTIRNATIEDFDDDVLDFYDGDIDELLEEKIIDSGDGERYLSITKPAFRKDKETGKRAFYRNQTGDEDFLYLVSDLVFVNEEQEVDNIDDIISEDFDIDLDDIDLD